MCGSKCCGARFVLITSGWKTKRMCDTHKTARNIATRAKEQGSRKKVPLLLGLMRWDVSPVDESRWHGRTKEIKREKKKTEIWLCRVYVCTRWPLVFSSHVWLNMYALPYAEHTSSHTEHVLDAAFAMQLHLCVHVVIKYYPPTHTSLLCAPLLSTASVPTLAICLLFGVIENEKPTTQHYIGSVLCIAVKGLIKFVAVTHAYTLHNW